MEFWIGAGLFARPEWGATAFASVPGEVSDGSVGTGPASRFVTAGGPSGSGGIAMCTLAREPQADVRWCEVPGRIVATGQVAQGLDFSSILIGESEGTFAEIGVVAEEA